MSYMSYHFYMLIVLPPVTQGLERPTNPSSSFCTVQKRLLLPSKGCSRLTQGQSTGGIAAETNSFSLPWTQLTSPVGLEKGLLKCCRCGLFNTISPSETFPWWWVMIWRGASLEHFCGLNCQMFRCQFSIHFMSIWLMYDQELFFCSGV